MIGSELNTLSLKHLRNSLVEVRSTMLDVISWSSEDWPEIEIHTWYSGHWSFLYSVSKSPSYLRKYQMNGGRNQSNQQGSRFPLPPGYSHVTAAWPIRCPELGFFFFGTLRGWCTEPRAVWLFRVDRQSWESRAADEVSGGMAAAMRSSLPQFLPMTVGEGAKNLC